MSEQELLRKTSGLKCSVVGCLQDPNIVKDATFLVKGLDSTSLRVVRVRLCEAHMDMDCLTLQGFFQESLLRVII